MNHTTVDTAVKRIARAGQILSDPKRIYTILSLLNEMNRTATDLNPAFKEDFSSTTKRLATLQSHNLLGSRKDGSRREYSVHRMPELIDSMEALLKLGKRLK